MNQKHSKEQQNPGEKVKDSDVAVALIALEVFQPQRLGRGWWAHAGTKAPVAPMCGLQCPWSWSAPCVSSAYRIPACPQALGQVSFPLGSLSCAPSPRRNGPCPFAIYTTAAAHISVIICDLTFFFLSFVHVYFWMSCGTVSPCWTIMIPLHIPRVLHKRGF